MIKIFISTLIALLVFIQPVFANVSPINDGVIKCTNPEEYGFSHQVRWGYNNSTSNTITVPIGDNNKFTGGGNINLGQPEEFLPGRFINLFRTPIATGQTFVWRLNNRTATATIPNIERERICIP